jgi:hypothetical protein
MAFSRLNKQNLSFYLNQNQIHGVQDIQASNQLPMQHVKFLGMNSSFYAPEGPKIGNLSITSLLTTNNEFYNCTGDSGNFGFITKKQNPSSNILYGFKSGYLNTYNCGAQIGEIPTVKADFSIINDAGEISTQGDFNSTTVPSLVNTNSIDIGIADFNTNRVSSFNLSLNINRNIAYYVGSDVPFSVKSLYPIELNCDFNIAQDDYSLQKLSDLTYDLKNNPSFYIKTKDFLGNSVDFDFSNSLCYFIDYSEDYSASVNSPVGITVRYRGYLK